MKVLIACERSGIVREAFAARGHDAWSCDLEETDIPGQHIVGDVLEILRDSWDLIVAHPPCTYLTVTNNRSFVPEQNPNWRERVAAREEAVEFFMALYNAPAPRVAVENPVGIMSTRFRRPDQYIHPCQFGHAWTKKTGLWLKNLPILVPRFSDFVNPEYVILSDGTYMSAEHYRTACITDRKERSRQRSNTPSGIARAMAEHWG